MNFYYTFDKPISGEISEKGSKFIALGFPIQHKHHIKEFLKQVKVQHPKARHYCYAYRLGLNLDNFRAYDDGEPSGTAGKPILGQIDSFQCTNCLVIVVRYFGGVLLGTQGLIKAYKSAAKEALSKAEIIQKTPHESYKISGSIQNIQTVLSVLKDNKVSVTDFQFTDIPYVIFNTAISQSNGLFIKVKSKLDQMPSSKVTDPFQLTGCTIEITSSALL